MRLVGFLTGFALIAAAVVFLMPCQTMVTNHKSGSVLSDSGDEKAETPARKPKQLNFSNSDQNNAQLASETVIPETRARPGSTEENLLESTEKIKAINPIPVTPSGVENKTEPKDHPVTQPITPKKAKIPTSNETLTVTQSPEKTTAWQPFWGPFNTPGSAESFAKSLTQKTALDIRVTETKPGRFMIMYPYLSEDDRQKSARLIEQKTGLRIKLR